jgi:hypothetical protein
MNLSHFLRKVSKEEEFIDYTLSTMELLERIYVPSMMPHPK